MTACGLCPGDGWQVVDPKDFGEPSDVRPCPICRPEQFTLWQRGAFRPVTSTRAVVS